MTDTELVKYFKNHKDGGCGRFSAEQLDKDILMPKKPLPWIKYFFQFSLPAFLLSLKSTAQSQKIIISTEILSTSEIPVSSKSVKEKIKIDGRVRQTDGNPISYATVSVLGTKNTVMADSEGRFTLGNVPANGKISVSAVGFITVTIRVNSDQDGLLVTLNRAEIEMMGAVVITTTRRRSHKTIQKQEKPLAPIPSILAYPNPINSGSMLNIRCNNLEAGNFTLEFYTLTGQLVKTTRVAYSSEKESMSVPTTQMLPSTYILKVTNEKSGKHFSQQVVVE